MGNERQCERVWMQRRHGSIVRLLIVDRYDESGNERHNVMRLPVDDPRPMGRHLSGMIDSGIAIYESLPFRQWTEIVWI